MSTIIEKVRSFNDFASLKAAPEADITKAEKQLALKFAAEYREYTATFGAVAANGHELTGVVVSKRLNVVSTTKTEWGNNPQVPRTMYVIENAGIDGILVWQDESGAVYQSAPNAKPKKVAASLADYIEK
ncbi:MAG: cell wall assembly/cell proliferation coordinating protein, KNR4-like protein [Candidatus Cloacimonetes bacterium]|jgi:hypothetical protein|nr:cell wall assembly/cell proliferation coordinating protein, KNR4-like protein [Candidatus Cloacimonadota bacterium]